jgi:hypothetical protein
VLLGVEKGSKGKGDQVRLPDVDTGGTEVQVDMLFQVDSGNVGVASGSLLMTQTSIPGKGADGNWCEWVPVGQSSGP